MFFFFFLSIKWSKAQVCVIRKNSTISKKAHGPTSLETTTGKKLGEGGEKKQEKRRKKGSFSCGLFLWCSGRGPGYGSCPSLCVRETESPTGRRNGVRLHPSFSPTTPYRYIHTNLHAAAAAKYEHSRALMAKIALAS